MSKILSLPRYSAALFLRVQLIDDITRWGEDMNFIFEWKNNILRTSAASE